MTAVPAVATTALTAHPIYETYAELLGDAVVVSLHSLAFLRGALFGIDPENGNVILFEWLPDENDKAVRTHTVMAHAIASIERDTDESSTDVSTIRLRLAATMQLSHASQTLESLRQHLQQHCIEASIDATTNELIVFGGAATIAPPYDEFSVCAKNDLVLQRLTSLLRLCNP
ncbi:hypothetical protein AaE_002999 [Aphanomyces astaci]|uniref:AD domain-containing protein n=1 Tax=Aphanomyces astaci TaxID=112090 RepID=A0A6A5ARW2_APHAT|nr:hypothetical protein AaE_002999 [Aphanomyces astaci]